MEPLGATEGLMLRSVALWLLVENLLPVTSARLEAVEAYNLLEFSDLRSSSSLPGYEGSGLQLLWSTC